MACLLGREWCFVLCSAGVSDYNENLKEFQERDGQYPKLSLAKISQLPMLSFQISHVQFPHL